MSEDSGFQIGQNAPGFNEAHVSRLMAPFVDASGWSGRRARCLSRRRGFEPGDDRPNASRPR